MISIYTARVHPSFWFLHKGVLLKHHTLPRGGWQPIAGLPPAVCHQNPIIHMGEERQSEAIFLSKKTTWRQNLQPTNIFVQSTDLKFKVLTESSKPGQRRKSGSSGPLLHARSKILNIMPNINFVLLAYLPSESSIDQKQWSNANVC